MTMLRAFLISFICSATAIANPPDFDTTVAPLLVKRCAGCHSGEKPKGDLDITKQAEVMPADVWKRVVADEMPPKKPLSSEEKATLKTWIESGAKWGRDPIKLRSDAAWWSFQPLKSDRNAASQTIDQFLLAKLNEKNLTPVPIADRRTLIRRLHFDLTGLPPTPGEIDTFLKDTRPNAYEKLVDELLASPRYGERWARHWLDVVHYGETHGYDKDKPRPNAWPYRDYVIRALNTDKPYSRFVQEQIAGDVIFPGTVDGIEALGFLAAGPWDFIGHEELPESKIDGQVARHLDRDDFVSNTTGTFLSLTVHCAQCHDHKFDPISQREYYSLQAVFAAIDRTERAYDPELTTSAKRLAAEQRRLTAKINLAAIETKAGKDLIDLDRKIADTKRATGQKQPEYGYHSAIETTQNLTKWVRIDLGESKKLSRVVLRASDDDFNKIGPGFGFPVRFKLELSDDPQFSTFKVIADHNAKDFPNPGVAEVSFTTDQSGQYLRVTATKLAPRQPTDFIFALAELEAYDASGKNVALGTQVTAHDSIEAPVRWRKSNLTDGIAPPNGNATKSELVKLMSQRTALLVKFGAERILAELRTAEEDLAKLGPAKRRAYIGSSFSGTGNFAGTGGKPRPIHILHRGDVTKPGDLVRPGVLAAIPLKYSVDSSAPEGERRAALARWLTDKDNPLIWRSIVNRIWQYHFGRGLVDTPNDFGRMGELPTHPELLDWLAIRFRDGGGSLKSLHKLIVTSDAYQRASSPNVANTKLDADNRNLWRQNRRKLEAEAVRDSILFVAGKLDLTMGGPSFRDFVIERPEHSPHYQYHLSDPEDSKTHRRAVYRFIVRSKPEPFLTALDCADPSLAVDKRNQTLAPQQALAFLNNKLTLAMAMHFARRVESMATDHNGQIRAAFRLAIGREASEKEVMLLVALAKEHGLAIACRAILNLNEFVFVD